MIPKLNLVSALAAVLFFFLPWTSIECNGRQMATQTGFQVLSGGGTTVGAAVEQTDSLRLEINSRKSASLGNSYLVIVALLCAAAAVVSSFATFLTGPRHHSGIPGMLCACALVCLIAQAAMSFPAKRELMKEVAGRNGGPSRSAAAGFEQAISAEIAGRIQVRPLPGFYAELAALGIPTLILLNGLLDRLRAASEIRA